MPKRALARVFNHRALSSRALSSRALSSRALAAGALLAAASIGLAPQGIAAAPILPPLSMTASAERHPGKVVLDQLVTPDLDAAEHFYTGLFGWSFRPLDAGRFHYATAMLGDRPVARLFQLNPPSGERRPSQWLTFFSTADVDAAVRIATQHGAHTLFGPRAVPDLGDEAVLRDPQGGVFALLASTSGDPPDVAAATGDWIWRSLITPDPDNAAAFYQTILGFDVYDVTGDAPTRHLILASGNYARASVNALPSSRPDAHPRWLNYVRVEDVAASAAKAVTLGGRILVQPHLDNGGSRIAILADPLGAPFGVMEFSATGSQTGAK